MVLISKRVDLDKMQIKMWGVKDWNRFLRGMADAQSLETLKVRLDGALV